MKQSGFTRLYKFLSRLSYEDLPEIVIDRTKLCLMDTIGIMVGATGVDTGRRLAGLWDMFGHSAGGSSVMGTGKRVSATHAAFINGALAEVLEMQDGIRYGGVHPSSTVIPAVLALAQGRSISGKELILSIFAGYEFLGRMTRLVYPQPLFRGFNMTGACGAFGAAMGCSKLLGFDAERMDNSMGICAMYSPISSRAAFYSEVKPTHAGRASEAGFLSALITERGIEGARQVLETEGHGGICTHLIAQCKDLDQVGESLGEHFQVNEVYFKPFPSCRHTHGAVQATLQLMDENRLGAEDGLNVEVATYDVAKLAVGDRRPDLKSADCIRQFSIPYVVSACLMSGSFRVEEIFGTTARDPRVYDFQSKVHVHEASEITDSYPETTATQVEIILESGKRFSKRVELPKGDPRNPLGREELEGKFRDLVSGILGMGKTERLLSNIRGLESMRDVSGFISDIGPDESPPSFD